MNRPITIGTLFGKDLRIHWSWPLLPVGVAGYSFVVDTWQQSLFQLAILLTIYLIVLFHESVQFLAAHRLGVGTRDVTLYPFWCVSRAMRLSDRPWQEKVVATTGLAVLALFPAITACAITMSGGRLTMPPELVEPKIGSFLLYLFWASVLLIALHMLPLMPLDCGRLVRASLVQRTTRLRATEVAAIISTVGAGILLFTAVIWMKSPFLAVVAVLVFLAAQEDLDRTRRFEKFRIDLDQDSKTPSLLVPIEAIVTPDCRPNEPNFSGFTWNPRARLWIEWRDGQPVSANAMLGDGQL